MFNFAENTSPGIPILALRGAALPTFEKGLRLCQKTALKAQGFAAAPEEIGYIFQESGALERVVFGAKKEKDAFWSYGQLATRLPAGTYVLEGIKGEDLFWAAFAWGMAFYRFDRYKKTTLPEALLALPDFPDQGFLKHLLEATFLVRDLINVPANDLGTTQLALQAQRMAEAHGASFREIVGEALLQENFPLVYAVGKAGETPPRLVEMTWGNPGHPQVALVGKGVCFDTGGLNLKTGGGMVLMKKDMGGAATVLGLASLIMAEKLPVYLRVVMPMVENNVGPNAMRPGDVYPSRGGKSVEIGNTDAEGRLILADALSYASDFKPAVMIDFATLTGAMRVALGEELPGFFTNTPALADELMEASLETHDPLWPMPLFAPYRPRLKSSIADLNNIGTGDGMGGAIIAALFLEEFVGTTPWIHIDHMAWNKSAKPGKPLGGEAMGLRAVYRLLKTRYK